ncbi:hypothetical protein BDV29DRAFT_163264 [Aspergillus leporis]|uniref:Uncharacterized protein n=1 Tax=Aspergillus leporis TaxID=41062 RepID=A0A5N5WGS9_9EURO|nr:hypothetical protein BDV29DRAFT_163264 [Aspergillus leporis]
MAGQAVNPRLSVPLGFCTANWQPPSLAVTLGHRTKDFDPPEINGLDSIARWRVAVLSVCIPKSLCTPKSVRTPQSVQTPKSVRTPRSVCTPKSVRTPKSVCTPKTVCTPKSVCTLYKPPRSAQLNDLKYLLGDLFYQLSCRIGVLIFTRRFHRGSNSPPKTVACHRVT